MFIGTNPYLQTRFHLIQACVIAAVFAELSCAAGLPDITGGALHGQVLAVEPVIDARVQVWRIDDHGERIELVGDTITDSKGRWSVNIQFVTGAIAVEVSGGTTTEPWAPGRTISLHRSVPGDPLASAPDKPLRAVIMDYTYGTHILITPYTTIAAALGEAWLARGVAAPYGMALRRAYKLVGRHLGGAWAGMAALSLYNHGPFDIRTTNLNPDTRHALMLAALSTLAERIAAASTTGALTLNTLRLTRMLERDAADGVFDGRDADGVPIRVGAGACTDPLCQLGPNTLRAELATALAFYYLPSEHNRTGLVFNDVRPWIEAIWMNDDSSLFGTEPIAPLGGEQPLTIIQPTYMDDEALDTITFTAAAEPIHMANEPSIRLDGSAPCPTVHKYVHRMDDPANNPIIWNFDVIDRRGVGIDPDQGEYRVGIRNRGTVTWLTGWRPATPMPDTWVDNGYRYRVILTRSEIPELGTIQATFRLEFRGADTLGQIAPAARACWEHVPLAAPLYVGEAREVPASDPWSLRSIGIGNGLAPLLNGAPPAQGRALVEFDIKNGTTEPVYVTLDVSQPVAIYTKSWQKTNAYLFDNPAPSYCLRDGTCTQEFPPTYGTTMATQVSGTIKTLVDEIVIEDATTGEQLFPCATCAATEYRILPRNEVGSPRQYRVRLMVSDLSAIAPSPNDLDYGPYDDISLDPEVFPFAISGRRFSRLSVCRWARPHDAEVCELEQEFVHYLALTRYWIRMDWLRVRGRTRATANLPAVYPSPQPNTFGVPVQNGPIVWTAQQSPTLPEPAP